MVSKGEHRKRRGAGLLLILFASGLVCLALPETAASGVATAWVRRYNGPANGVDQATAMALDSKGNVYVTGYSESSGKEINYDYLTIKYSPKGKRLWARRYHGPGNEWTNWDEATAIAVDGQDNVYVTGNSAAEEYGGECATIKYNPDGKELWVQRYRNVDPIAIAIDALGNVYVTGEDSTTIKYSPDGQPLWARISPAPGFGVATAIAADSQGSVYVTGWSLVWEHNTRYLTLKFSPDGVEKWFRVYDRVDNPYYWECPSAIAVDSHGNVYVTGTSGGYGSGDDYVTIRYMQTPRTGR